MYKRIPLLLLILLFVSLCGCGEVSTSSNQPVNESGVKIALLNCRVIDCTGAEPTDGMTIFIKNGLIEKIVKTEGNAVPEEYQQIDVCGCTVMPGIINTHVHCGFTPSILYNWLTHGVTTVRELATIEGQDAVGMRDENNKSPDHSRIVIATPIITKKEGGYIPPFDAGIDSPEQAAKKTEQLLKKDYDVVKIAIEDSLQLKTWNMLTTEEVKSITDTAHASNMWVAVHISHTRNLPIAIDGGVDELSHMTVEPLTDDLVNQIVAKGMYWVPTLELWNEISQTYSIEWDQTAIQNLSMFYKAGGKIALGTDFGGYFTPFEQDMPLKEMNLMKAAGMTNMDILMAATKNASVVCRMQDSIGTLETGKIADILVINGDPLQELEVLTDLKMVIHNGNIVIR